MGYLKKLGGFLKYLLSILTFVLSGFTFANGPNIGDSATYSVNGNIDHKWTVTAFDPVKGMYEVLFESSAQKETFGRTEGNIYSTTVISTCGDFVGETIETIDVVAGKFQTCKYVWEFEAAGELVKVSQWRADRVPFITVKETREHHGGTEVIELTSFVKK